MYDLSNTNRDFSQQKVTLFILYSTARTNTLYSHSFRSYFYFYVTLVCLSMVVIKCDTERFRGLKPGILNKVSYELIRYLI